MTTDPFPEMSRRSARRLARGDGPHFHRDDEPPLPPWMIGCECTGTFVRRHTIDHDLRTAPAGGELRSTPATASPS